MNEYPIVALSALGGSDTQLTEEEIYILTESMDDEDAYEVQFEKITLAAGGSRRWECSSGDTIEKLSGIVLLARINRAYYLDKQLGSIPYCASPNGRIGYVNIEDPDAIQLASLKKARRPHPSLTGQPQEGYACVTCAMNKYGSDYLSGEGFGPGKACKETRRLLILPDGWRNPALLSIPATSVKAWDAFATGLDNRRSAFHAVRVKFTLEQNTSQGGQKYCKILPEQADGKPTFDEIKMIGSVRKYFRAGFDALAVEVDEYLTNGAGPPDEQAAIDAEVVNGDQEDIPF